MADARLTVTFWDVGQGDCSTITLPDGGLIIIDTGPRGSPLIDWLNDKPKAIRAVVLTHNDSDHVGALPALIGAFKDRIQSLFMLVDRPTAHPVFDKTFRCALEGERRGYYQISRLEIGATVWRDDTLQAELTTVFPNMSGNVLATTPNTTSGILALRLNSATQVLWPGDSTLERVARECAGSNPLAMVGPHHGAPADYKKKSALPNIAQIRPQHAYISVGTKNNYSHPRPGYLQRLERAGCHAFCSQLTRACDPASIIAQRPIMVNHLVLGLRPPRRLGVACRGAWQLIWNGTAFESDGLDAEHLRRITPLRRPQCLRGRRFFEASQVQPPSR